MNLLKYTIFLVLTLLVSRYLLNNVLKDSLAININTPGIITEHLKETGEVLPTSSEMLKDLDRDIKSFAKGNFLQEGGGLPSIPHDGPIQMTNEDPSGCKACYGLLPGSPGANQYNYGVSVDCGCKGITGDMISSKCGKVTALDANELAIRDNFQKSTPEVINKRQENWIPNHLISQLHYVGPFRPNEVVAANQNVSESPCDFGSEKTNLAQYFKANPDLFLDTDKYSTFKPFVPYTSAWQEKSDCYNNLMYEQDESIRGNFLVNKVQ